MFRALLLVVQVGIVLEMVADVDQCVVAVAVLVEVVDYESKGVQVLLDRILHHQSLLLIQKFLPLVRLGESSFLRHSWNVVRLLYVLVQEFLPRRNCSVRRHMF